VKPGPTIDEIRTWPATVDPPTGGSPFGISRSYSYELIKRGEFPAKVIKVGGKYRVVTASILAVLGAQDADHRMSA
jgi:predicted DNA-binding transcriptional regulator AlpA